MSRLTKMELTPEERIALETGYRQGKTHAFRQHCRMILLKAQKKTSAQIAEQLDCCQVSVNGWVKRYKSEGIAGLEIRQGRGRKPILSSQEDMAAVRLAVQENRQRLRLAQAALQEELGKAFSTTTLKRFLKNIVAATNGFGDG